jgi:hypothetical protein
MHMSDKEFKALLDWYAASCNLDWSSLDSETINALIDRESSARGYASWAKAKHDLDVRFA